MSQAIIDVKGLKKSFDNKVVVESLDLLVKPGEVFGFLGPNGSGKTTSIRMLCGLLTPDAGSGTCLGYDILHQSRQIKRQVGYMTQKFSFYTDLTVEENLHFIARIYRIAQRIAKVEEIIETFGLEERRKQLTGELSGGWKQRVALAACLLHEPKLLLLDEPTAGVDPMARREFWDKIHSLSQQGITTFISTHYMDEAERCTRLAYLAYGKLLITGTVEEVISSTYLMTWEISGEVNTALLQKIKAIESIEQAALFGEFIHVSGVDKEKIEKELQYLSKKYPISFKSITPTLEDAFIHLVKKTLSESEFRRRD